MAVKTASKSILMVLQRDRRLTAARVQEIFTEFGCVIRTRLGLHDGTGEQCSNAGLIILELAGDPRQHRKLAAALGRIRGVKTKLASIGF